MTEQDKHERSLLDLPLEIYTHILSFLSEREREEVVLNLRLVSKVIKNFLNNDSFLKTNARIFFIKKDKILRRTFDKSSLILDQIEEWKNIESRIKETYQNIYQQLPHIEKIHQLLDNIKNTPLPNISGYNKFKGLLALREVKIYMALLIASTIVAIYFSGFELPKAAKLIQELNKIANQLRAEGCIINYSSQGTTTIAGCSDTIKINKYFELGGQIDRYLIPGTTFDIFYIGMIITFMWFIRYRYKQLQNNINSYEQLNIAVLSEEHRQLFLEIQKEFPRLDLSKFSTIEDLVKGLKNLINECALPEELKDHVIIGAVHKDYLSLLDKFKKEISALEDESIRKSSLSSYLASGESKTSFRRQIYTFFDNCNQAKKYFPLSKNDSDEMTIEDLIKEDTPLIKQ